MKTSRRKCSLEEVLGKYLQEPYEAQYLYVKELLDTGKIKAVKTSPGNGRKPALYTSYWIEEEKPDYSEWKDELLYQTEPGIKIDFYLRNMEVYHKERCYVRRLSDYLRNKKDLLSRPLSRNERSFEIWGEEKCLISGPGKKVLSHCAIEETMLNMYPTVEPFSYFAAVRSVPQKMLILENKDPFFGMRQFLLEGNTSICGEKIGTLIYGAGKRVISSFREFRISAEPYMKEAGNELLYFGDLDYEGIGIYEELAESFRDQGEIRPFVPAYLTMLEKAGQAASLPLTKEQQNRNITGYFFSYFDAPAVQRMKTILENNRYIPQEILHTGDY